MVGGDFLNSSVNESASTLNFDIPAELDSIAESFHSPADKGLLAANRRRKSAGLLRTPRQPFAERQLPNKQAATGKHEFTPLLKSAVRNNSRKSLEDIGENATPSAWKRTRFDEGSGSLELPKPIDQSTMDSEEFERTINGVPPMASSSMVSTPAAKSSSGGPSMFSSEGQLSLRDQEKVIDEIKKENFSLKLKIFFLDNKLKQLGPEYNKAAIKENIDLKVNLTTLRDELRRYKKSLKESERIIADLQKELQQLQRGGSSKGGSGMDAERMAELQRTIEEKEAELNEVLDENDNLREQVHEYMRRVEDAESGDDQEIGKLKDQIQELLADKEDLEAELRSKDMAVQDKEDAMENFEDQLKEKAEEINRLQQEREDLLAKIKSIEKRLSADGDKASKEAQRRIDELEATLEKLRGELDDERLEKNEAVREKEDIEDKFEKMEEERAEIEKELQEVEEQNEALLEQEAELKKANRKLEVDKEELLDQIRDNSFKLKSTATEKDERMRLLELDVQRLKVEKDNLENSNKEHVEENVRLRKRVEELNGDFEKETKSLLDEIELLKLDKETLTRDKSSLELELRRTKTDFNSVSSEKELLVTRHTTLTTESKELQRDLERLQTELKSANTALEREREYAEKAERDIQEEANGELDRLQNEIERLQAQLKEEGEAFERKNKEWNLERQRMDAKLEKSEANVKAMQDTLDRLQSVETTLQGKEARIQEALLAEKSRSQREEQALNRQINELNEEITERKHALEDKIDELRIVREELRISHRNEKTLEEKVAALTEEIEVLHEDLDKQGNHANLDVVHARSENEQLRQKLNSTKQELVRVENQLVSTQNELDSLRGDLQTETVTQKQLKLDLEDAHRRLESAKKDKQALHEQMVSLTSQFNVIKLQKVEVECERDELYGKLDDLQSKADVSVFDQEKLELRKLKSKLEIELQRVKDERDMLNKKTIKLENDLDEAFQSAEIEEEQMEAQIRELTRKFEAAGDPRELASAKKTIARLEARIEELSRPKPGPSDETMDAELAAVRERLQEARQRESELLKREAEHKKAARELREKIDDLEAEVHQARNGAIASTPAPSTPKATRRAEVDNLKRQLSASRDEVQELKLQMRALDKQVANFEAKAHSAEQQKELLEQDLQTLRETKDELYRQNEEATAAIGQLRQRVFALEKDVQTARISRGRMSPPRQADAEKASVDQKERRELHEHLKEAMLKLDTAEAQLASREEALNSHLRREATLEQQIRSLRKERVSLQEALSNTEKIARKAQRKVKESEARVAKVREEWMEERRLIKANYANRDQRNINMAIRDQDQLQAQAHELSQQVQTHQYELKGLAKQIIFLKEKVKRERGYRKDLCFTKDFFLLQVKMFNTCNEAHLQLIEQMGIQPDRRMIEKRPSLKAVAIMFIAGIRIRNRTEKWSETMKIRKELDKAKDKMKQLKAQEEQQRRLGAQRQTPAKMRTKLR